MRRLPFAAGAIALALFAPGLALADGPAQASSGVNLIRGGSAGPAGATTTEHGVRVYRVAAPAPELLAGGAEAAPAPAPNVKVVVIHHYHSKLRRLRTQGFYSGHPGKSRRFTQGFYSGPVDKGRRPVRIRRAR